MKNVCVITGGGSGMGLSVAKLLEKDIYIILAGRTVSKLEGAVEELKAMGKEVEAYPCDVSDRESVKALAAHAAGVGNVKMVCHAAGVSPTMCDAAAVFAVDCLGTINVNEEFAAVMGEKSCVLNISSSAPVMLPRANVPRNLYPLADKDPDAFVKNMMITVNLGGPDFASGMAYSLAKDFVIWYTKTEAMKYGRKGIRFVSVGPGTILTDMGKAEAADGDMAMQLAMMGALGRAGEPEEVAELMVFLLSDKASYITGVDIPCDGGSQTGFQRLNEVGFGDPDAFRPISAIKQIGIITDDLEKTKAAFEKYGIVGWMDVQVTVGEQFFENAICYDKPQMFSVKSTTTSMLGIELELVEPMDEHSDYAAFLKKNGGPGIHHLSVETNDIGAVEALGKQVVVGAKIKGAPFGYKYFDFQDELGLILEYFPYVYNK